MGSGHGLPESARVCTRKWFQIVGVELLLYSFYFLSLFLSLYIYVFLFFPPSPQSISKRQRGNTRRAASPMGALAARLSLDSTRYANRAKNIRNKPKINEDPKDAMLRE